MPAAAVASPSSFKALPPLPAGFLYQPQAVRRAVEAEQRRAAANAVVAKQMNGASIDNAWSDVAAKLSATLPAVDAARQEPRASAPDHGWGDIIAKQNRPQPHGGRR